MVRITATKISGCLTQIRSRGCSRGQEVYHLQQGVSQEHVATSVKRKAPLCTGTEANRVYEKIVLAGCDTQMLLSTAPHQSVPELVALK